VPVVGNLDELQHGIPTPARGWFMRMAAPVNPRVLQGRSGQGFYIVSADGRAYGHTNRRTVEALDGLMDRGLSSFRRAPHRPFEWVTGDDIFMAEAPPGAAVLRSFTRIAPVPTGAASANRNVGRDHVWIYRSEMRRMLEAPEDARVSAPRSLALRLARYHLIDNVRGEPDLWEASEIRGFDLAMRRRADASGRHLVTFHGPFEIRSGDGRRGFAGVFSAEMLVATNGAVLRFRGYARGEAFGQGQWTPGAPKGKFPLHLAFVDANDATARMIPPNAVSKGEPYDPDEIVLGRKLEDDGTGAEAAAGIYCLL
jgi:hypothetical protein